MITPQGTRAQGKKGETTMKNNESNRELLNNIKARLEGTAYGMRIWTYGDDENPEGWMDFDVSLEKDRYSGFRNNISITADPDERGYKIGVSTTCYGDLDPWMATEAARSLDAAARIARDIANELRNAGFRVR